MNRRARSSSTCWSRWTTTTSATASARRSRPGSSEGAVPIAGAAPAGCWDVRLGARRYDVHTRALVMGVVNRTPDSFFDHGATFALDKAVGRAAALAAAGADLIDVGGVRAGVGPEVTVAEEIDRVVPVIEAIASRLDVAISVDTWQAAVADAAFAAGASLGNDISGFADPDYLPTAKRHGASVVATHIRLRPRVLDPAPTYPDDDVVAACVDYLTERRDRALAAGLGRDQVILDAGLDLGKSTPQSLELLRRSEDICALGQPVLLAASNKDFLGELLGLAIDRRRDATLAAISLGIARGCRVLRVHDVAGAARVVRTMQAILEA